MTDRRRFIALAVAGGASAVGGTATWAKSAPTDPLAALRQQAELARQRSVPPPPEGVLDLKWHQLSPPGWNPRRILEQLGVAELEDDDPRVPAVLAKVRRDWDQARAVRSVPAQAVRMLGFPAMPDSTGATTKQVLLVPYYGNCLHSPPPAPNQIVQVGLRVAMPSSMYQFPVWVIGKLAIKDSTTRRERISYRVAYSMADATWEPYPYTKFPMPPYQWPR